MSAAHQDSWQWQLSSPEILTPWLASLSCPAEGYIKNLPHRKVFRVHTDGGDSLYIKQSICVSLFSRLKFLFIHPLQHEYSILRRLQKEHIPCIEAVGYGLGNRQELLLTRSLDGCVTALEFWHRLAPESPCLEKEFLQSLTELLKVLKSHHYLHGDFHPENILYQKQSRRLFIVDPYKLKKCRSFQKHRQNMLFCNGLLFMSDRLEDRQIEEILLKSGIVSSQGQAEQLLADARAHRRKIDRRKYHKRVKKVLTGTSQFSRIENLAEGRLHIRNTEWNSPQPFCRTQMKTVECYHDNAMKQWVDSILPLNGKTAAEVPAAWLESRNPEQPDLLFYTSEKATHTQSSTEGEFQK